LLGDRVFRLVLQPMALNVPNDPNYWQNRAEEAWAQAEQMTDAHTKAVMVGIAQSYEKIVKWMEERSRQP
jgi:hypothetical protein